MHTEIAIPAARLTDPTPERDHRDWRAVVGKWQGHAVGFCLASRVGGCVGRDRVFEID